jgi:hypothetical protein
VPEMEFELTSEAEVSYCWGCLLNPQSHTWTW